MYILPTPNKDTNIQICNLKYIRLKRTDDILVKLIAKRIRQLRDERGFTQEYIVECTRLDIPHFEMGESTPSLFSLALLCKFLDITLYDFSLR